MWEFFFFVLFYNFLIILDTRKTFASINHSRVFFFYYIYRRIVYIYLFFCYYKYEFRNLFFINETHNAKLKKKIIIIIRKIVFFFFLWWSGEKERFLLRKDICVHILNRTRVIAFVQVIRVI